MNKVNNNYIKKSGYAYSCASLVSLMLLIRLAENDTDLGQLIDGFFDKLLMANIILFVAFGLLFKYREKKKTTST